MKKRISVLGYGLVFFIPLVLDRVTKAWALAHPSHHVNQFLSCHYLVNRGVSWSFLHAQDSTIFTLVSLLVVLVLSAMAAYALIRHLNHQMIYGELLVLSGAISNVIDRIVYHGVIDFIAIQWNGWHFPVFNLADVFIVLGVGIIVLFSSGDV